MSYRESSVKPVQALKPPGPNLQLRSNVYLRQTGTRLRDDNSFLRRVRGLAAIRKLLGYFGLQPTQQRHDDPEVLRLVELGKLTAIQQNALRWELACAQCESIPCGETFEGKFEFRCDRADCTARKKSSVFVVRSILVPISNLQLCRDDPSKVLSLAIEQCRGIAPKTDLQPPFHSLPVRVSSNLDRLYGDQELAAFLVYGIQHSQAR